MASKDIQDLQMEVMVYNSVAVLCVLAFIVVCVISLANGKRIETTTFGLLIAAGGVYGGGVRARKKIKELEKPIS